MTIKGNDYFKLSPAIMELAEKIHEYDNPETILSVIRLIRCINEQVKDWEEAKTGIQSKYFGEDKQYKKEFKDVKGNLLPEIVKEIQTAIQKITDVFEIDCGNFKPIDITKLNTIKISGLASVGLLELGILIDPDYISPKTKKEEEKAE